MYLNLVVLRFFYSYHIFPSKFGHIETKLSKCAKSQNYQSGTWSANFPVMAQLPHPFHFHWGKPCIGGVKYPDFGAVDGGKEIKP